METFNATLEHSTTKPAPLVTCYPAKGDATGCGIIIFPGGGYHKLAEHEGAGYTNFFQEKGITCFVVTYRLAPHRHPAMLEDGFAVIETVRKNCKRWNLHPDKIGVMGSSAGGHLASTLITLFETYQSSVSLRPDFAILCYPVISFIEFEHTGSWNNLLGENASHDDRHALSSENNITSNTPPCFIWHTWEDSSVPVENTLMFANALRKKGVRFDLHIFEKGGHGLGLKGNFEWTERCVQWISETVDIT